jgi:two-component system sensor histidine kinase PilS (NtrC family)
MTQLSLVLTGRVGQDLEFGLSHVDGRTLKRVTQTSVPLRDSCNEVTGMQCVAHDVTAQRELQEEVAAANRLADLGRMAASLAHEIRNPLGAILNSINTLRKIGPPSDPRLFAIVSQETARLNAVIDEFLRFARPPRRAPIPCDVAELINSTIVFFQHDAKVRDSVQIRVNCAPRLPIICADPDQLREVIWNLLANAAESRSDGLIDVEARVGKSGAMLQISVTDDGPGIPRGDFAAIFEPFYSTKAQGTGLGLAIASQIIRDHGGSITVENVAGRGAQFVVCLPGDPSENPSTVSSIPSARQRRTRPSVVKN